MVVSLGPGKFYGSSLPRPRFYTDVKLNDERVDPPPPIMDPLMSWAHEAHWSMGGLSFQRHRLQGQIEGNINKLRVQRGKSVKESQKQNSVKNSAVSPSWSPSPPLAPVAMKRRRIMETIDEDEEEKGNESEREIRRGAVRKLQDDFERVALENKMGSKTGSPAKNGGGVGGEGLGLRTRSKQKQIKEGMELKKAKNGKMKLVKGGKFVGVVVAASAGGGGVRSSPRLAKRGGSN